MKIQLPERLAASLVLSVASRNNDLRALSYLIISFRELQILHLTTVR